MTGSGAPALDISVAHQARIYDYLLGGKDNYAADRAATSPSRTWRRTSSTRRREAAWTTWRTR